MVIMKKILSVILLACFTVSCAESFLDTENLTKKDSQNFPQKPADVDQILTAAYHELLVTNAPLQSVFLVAEVMSDDRFGAGGSDDRFIRAVANYKKTNEDMFSDAWNHTYKGIYRCNFLLSTLDQVAWENEAQRNRYEGEAMFMRAYYYFDLVRLFGTVPLIIDPAPQNNPKATTEELYAQIASDLKGAIEKLPATKYQDIDKTMLGHATKWAAEGYMARVFLFYTGYYKKTALPLVEGGEVTSAEVKTWVDDCIANSGHKLLNDFRNLWPYSYCKDYNYTKDNGLSWIGEDGANTETVFCHKYSGNTWEGRNLVSLCWGMRYQPDYTACFPFGQGWGMGTVNPVTYEEWPDNDLRKKASILNAKDPAEQVQYVVNCQNQVEDTYLFQKKYTPINVKKLDGTGIQSLAAQLYGLTYDFQSENVQDLVILRFSDILLMGAEIGGANAQGYMDMVRDRVKLPSVPATLENIKNERHWELAFEGIRYYDLLRWHDESLLTKNRSNIEVLNLGVAETISIPFRTETGGFVQIPQTQINLSGGVLTQNPGWEGSGNMY